MTSRADGPWDSVSPLGFSATGGAPASQPHQTRRGLIAAALFGTIVLQLAGAAVWLSNNTILIGRDASKYLLTSLEYTEFFDFSLEGLYQAFTYDPYRPPGLFLAIQPFYALLGRSADVAQLVNVFLLAVVILLVYFLGARVASPGVGLFSALLLSFLPMMTAMSRLLYTELLLTALVALNLLALINAQEFTRRGWTLVWGASLGAGLLVKWTMPIYVALPLVWFLWRARAIHTSLARLRQFRPDWQRTILAAILATTLALIWVWPNRYHAADVVAWPWQFLGWWLILFFLLMGLFHPTAPASNVWSAAWLGIVIASLWYLPHADIGWRLWAIDEERGAATAHPFNWLNYWRYIRYVYWEHLGPLAFWLIVPTALAPWLWHGFKRRTLSFAATPLWLSLLGALLALFMISQANARNLAALLPSATILAVIGVRAYPRPLRVGIGSLWLIALAIQWSLFTFDGLFSLYHATEPLWVRSAYLVQPASGPTDVGYAIAGNVLDRISGENHDRQFLAMLVNTPQLHRGSLRAQIVLEGRNVRIKDVTEDSVNPWYNILTSDWALVKDGDNRDVEGAARGVIDEILRGNALFKALYIEAARYVLPNGETVYLYKRATAPFGYPQMAPELLAATEELAAIIRNGWSEHASLIFANPDFAFWTALHGVPSDRVRVGSDADASPESIFAGEAGGPHTLFVVSGPESDAWLAWLDVHAYHALAVSGDFAGLDIYGWPSRELETVAVHGDWLGSTLVGLRSLAIVAPGQALPIESTWHSSTSSERKVSYRLLDGQGTVIAAADRPMASVDRLGLFVPPDVPAGLYTLAVVVYEAASLTPLLDDKGAALTPLFQVQVVPSPGP